MGNNTGLGSTGASVLLLPLMVGRNPPHYLGLSIFIGALFLVGFASRKR
jgi:hypothetical protein